MQFLHTTVESSVFWGVIAGLGFLFPGWWFISLLALGFWLANLREQKRPKQYFFSGWIFGLCKSLVVLSWFWSAYPATWLGFEAGPLHFLIVFLYWIPASVTLGLGTALFAVLFFLVQKYLQNAYLGVLLGGVLWVLGEVAGAYIFSLYTIGQHAGLNLGFSFGHFGYLLAASDFLVQLAQFGGVYMLSLIVFSSVAVLVLQTRSMHRMILAAFFTVCFLLPVSSQEHSSVAERVMLVESRFTADAPLSRIELEQVKFDLVKTALQSDASTIILPEDFRFTDYFNEPRDVLRYMHNISEDSKVLIDTTTVQREKSKILRAYVYDSQTDEITTFDKGYYVPQGEYTPYVYQGIIHLLNLPKETQRILAVDQAYYSEIAQTSVVLGERVPPVLFCFESVAPLGSQHIAKGRESVSFIAHPTSHSWFQHHQEILWNQLTAMLRVQSAWAGVPILQSGNTNPAQVVAPGKRVSTEVVADTQWWKLLMVSL